jgi:serine/threonine protein phosphatase PrpC
MPATKGKIKALFSVLDDSVNEAKKAVESTLSPENCLTEFGQRNLGEFLGYIRDLAIKDDAGNEAFSQKKLEEFVTKLFLSNENLASPQFFHNSLLEFHKQRALAESKMEQNLKTARHLITRKKEGAPLELYDTSGKCKKDVTSETNEGGLDIYYSETIGARSDQEDSFIIGEAKVDWPSSRAPHLMEEKFNKLGANIRAYCLKKKEGAGSTALLTHYSTDQKLTIGNLGDSRAVLFIKKRDGSIDWIRLTNDQEPEDILEEARIVKNGGFVEFYGLLFRVNGNLAVGRSFGDLGEKGTKPHGHLDTVRHDSSGNVIPLTNGKQLISYKPDIYQYDIKAILDARGGKGEEAFLLNSCDGLYDHGKGNETTYAKALEEWFKKGDVRTKWSNNIAEYLRDYAIALGSTDNVTVCVSNITNAPKKSVFNGVFDGHGGSLVSSLAATTLGEELLNSGSVIHLQDTSTKPYTPSVDVNSYTKAEEDLYPPAKAVRAKAPKTPAQTTFQDAVRDVFNSTTQANAEARAKLRDRLAKQVLPEWMADALKDSSQQYDSAEFTTFLFDAIIPDENKLTDATTIQWTGGKSEKSEKQTKLELPFKRKAGSADTDTIKCSEMLKAYGEIEDLTGDNQYAVTDYKKVDAKLSHRPRTDNPDLDIVMSLRRHASRIGVNGLQEQYRIDDPVDLDIIELDAPDNKKQKYEATSFIVHRGSINGGHYVTYVKEQKLSGETTWVLYNDSQRTELGIALPDESKQAYTIKFSPLANELNQDASRYKTKLPTSQGFGTENGGVRCWANAAFAFALSITSLHETDHTRAPEPVTAKPIIPSSNTTKLNEEQQHIESFVSNLIDFDAETASLSELIKKLEHISKNHSELRTKIDKRLEEVGFPLSKVILQNSVRRYLLKLAQGQDANKTDEILGLHEFFSDENNSKTTLEIIAEIKAKNADFIANPQEFCAKIISPGSTTIEAEKKKLKPKAPQFVTSQDLCYEAINKENETALKQLLPHAIKHDKDFLTNALCYAISNNKDSITATLINDHKADQKKTSTLYKQTAEKIATGSGKKIPQPKIKTSVSEDKVLISVAELVDTELKQFFEKEHAVTIADEAGNQKRNGQLYKIPELYQKEYIDLIKGKLRDNFVKLCGDNDEAEPTKAHAAEIKKQLEIAKKIFDERSDNIRCWKNIKRQEYEIRRFELKPGQVKLGNLMTQMVENMPFVNEDGNQIGGSGGVPKHALKTSAFFSEDGDYASNRTSVGSYHGYGDGEAGVGINPYSFVGGSQSEIDRVKYRDYPLVHTSMPPRAYRNIVFDSRISVLDDIKVNDSRLKVFLEEGREDLTLKERAGIKSRSKIWHGASNLAESFGDSVHQLTNWAGRGVLSSSKASDNNIYKDFLTRRNELIASMLWKAGPNAQDSSFYLKVLNKVNSALAGSDDIMDQATFQKMQKLITDEIKVEDTAVKAELDAFNKKLNDMNDSMLAGLQNHVDEDDRLWKYRCLQLFLLLTPLGAFSIAGQVFSYIDPLMELIGPLFDAGKTLGEGLGDMATSDVLGPFGQIAEAFRIDDGIELFFEKTPIVSDLCEIFDFATDNDLVQNALGAASPLQFSPIALLAPAALYSFFRADAEMTQYQKVSAYKESQQKALEEIFKEFEKGRESGFEKDDKGNIVIATKDFKNGKHAGLVDRVNTFAGKRMTTLKEANLDAKLVGFVSDPANADKLAKLFDGLEFKIKDAAGNTVVQSMSQILGNGGKKKFSEILYDVNSDAKKEALDRFLLFSAIQDSAKPFAENLTAFRQERSDADKKKLCDKSIKDLNYKFITKSAIKLNLTTPQKLEEIDKEAKDQGIDPSKVETQISELLEKQLLDLDTKYLFDLAKTKIPNGAVAEPKAMPLTKDPLFQDITVGGK